MSVRYFIGFIFYESRKSQIAVEGCSVCRETIYLGRELLTLLEPLSYYKIMDTVHYVQLFICTIVNLYVMYLFVFDYFSKDMAVPTHCLCSSESEWFSIDW